jgi:hypothetical protein
MSEMKTIIINQLQHAFDSTLQHLADLERLLNLFGQDMSWYEENTTIQRYKSLESIKYCQCADWIKYKDTFGYQTKQNYVKYKENAWIPIDHCPFCGGKLQ